MKLPLRLLTLVALLVFCFAALAVDHLPFGYAYYYYSDATYTTLVGYYIRECDRSVYSAGTVTTYREFEEWPCPHQ